MTEQKARIATRTPSFSRITGLCAPGLFSPAPATRIPAAPAPLHAPAGEQLDRVLQRLPAEVERVVAGHRDHIGPGCLEHAGVLRVQAGPVPGRDGLPVGPAAAVRIGPLALQEPEVDGVQRGLDQLSELVDR